MDDICGALCECLCRAVCEVVCSVLCNAACLGCWAVCGAPATRPLSALGVTQVEVYVSRPPPGQGDCSPCWWWSTKALMVMPEHRQRLEALGLDARALDDVLKELGARFRKDGGEMGVMRYAGSPEGRRWLAALGLDVALVTEPPPAIRVTVLRPAAAKGGDGEALHTAADASFPPLALPQSSPAGSSVSVTPPHAAGAAVMVVPSPLQQRMALAAAPQPAAAAAAATPSTLPAQQQLHAAVNVVYTPVPLLLSVGAAGAAAQPSPLQPAQVPAQLPPASPGGWQPSQQAAAAPPAAGYAYPPLQQQPAAEAHPPLPPAYAAQHHQYG